MVGDYYTLCLVLDEAGSSPISILRRKRQQYLKEHRPMFYSALFLSSKLCGYLTYIDALARNKLQLLITQLATNESINKHLKAKDQMALVSAMNNIRKMTKEIIRQELIYEEYAV